jgi:3-dehydroquinate synthase
MLDRRLAGRHANSSPIGRIFGAPAVGGNAVARVAVVRGCAADRSGYARAMRSVQVALGARSYSILIGPGLLSRAGRECARLGLARRCAVITDDQVAPLHAPAVMESLEAAGFEPVLITVRAGEKSKRWRTVGECQEQLAGRRLERKSFIAALGGGVVGDLAGFVAASYLRGIPFVQIPTTLLAQVDSSVGGKTGVNLRAGKNLVGAFHQPRLVLCDLAALTTLPEREYRAGLAEVIKYGVIYDSALFRRIELKLEDILSRKRAILGELVARCCQIKAEVVSQDETETGLRAILNFGHTIGHAIEAVSGYGKFLHGEAISIGQVAAARLSVRLNGFAEKEEARVRRLFERAGLPVSLRASIRLKDRLIEAMRLDKKVSGGEVKFVLASAIGKVDCGHAVPEAEIRSALDFPT